MNITNYNYMHFDELRTVYSYAWDKKMEVTYEKEQNRHVSTFNGIYYCS